MPYSPLNVLIIGWIQQTRLGGRQITEGASDEWEVTEPLADFFRRDTAAKEELMANRPALDEFFASALAALRKER